MHHSEVLMSDARPQLSIGRTSARLHCAKAQGRLPNTASLACEQCQVPIRYLRDVSSHVQAREA